MMGVWGCRLDTWGCRLVLEEEPGPPHRHVQLARTRRERLRGRADRDVCERADLQPYVRGAATLGARGCNPLCWRLQRYVLEPMSWADRPRVRRGSGGSDEHAESGQRGHVRSGEAGGEAARVVKRDVLLGGAAHRVVVLRHGQRLL
jgi:hypothetical protein